MGGGGKGSGGGIPRKCGGDADSRGGGRCGWVIVFDADLYMLPNADSVVHALNYGKEVAASAVFAYGEQRPQDRSYYDTFATVDMQDRFEKVPPGKAGQDYFRVLSGFGGVGVYDA